MSDEWKDFVVPPGFVSAYGDGGPPYIPEGLARTDKPTEAVMAKAKTKPRRPMYSQIAQYTVVEGGDWIDLEEGKRPPEGYHAARLKNGREWDEINGYRDGNNPASGGRPSKFDGIDLDSVALLAKRGWTDAEMAEFFKVNRDTWYEWKNRHPEFSEALKDWKVEADARVERTLYEKATGYEHPEEKIFCNEGVITRAETVKHYAPDTTAAIFWLKNRQPEQWRDRRELDVREIDTMTEDEVNAELAELEAAEAEAPSA